MADSAADFLPEWINLTALRKAADGCREGAPCWPRWRW